MSPAEERRIDDICMILAGALLAVLVILGASSVIGRATFLPLLLVAVLIVATVRVLLRRRRRRAG